MTAADEPEAGHATFRLLAATLALILAGVSLESLSPSVHLGGSLVLTIAVGAWWVASGSAGPALPQTAILLSIAGLLGLNAASLLWTPFPGPAYLALVEAVVLTALFLLVINLTKLGWRARTWQDSVVLLALALAAIEILLSGLWLARWQPLSGGSWLPPVGYRASGLLLGHPNVLAGLINLALPFLILRWIVGRGWRERWLLAAPIAALLAGLYLTSSRAGWISSAIGLLTVLFLLLVASRTRWRERLSEVAGAVRGWRLAVGLILVLIVGAAAQWQIARTGHQPLSRARTPVWAASLELLRASPWIGHGLRSYPVAYAALPSEYSEEDVPHAHNLVLQVGVETGAVGIGLLLVLLLGLAAGGWRAWSAADVDDRRHLAAYGGAAAACLSHNLSDFLFGPPLYSAAVAALAGTLLGRYGRSLHLSRPAARHQRALLALAPFSAVLLMVIPLRGAWDAWRGTSEARGKDWERAAEALCLAHEASPGEPVAAASCGLARAILSPQPPADSAATLDALAAAAELDPAWGLNWANLGASLLAAGESTAAADALDQGLRVYPRSGDLLLTRGLAYEAAGDRETAAALYRHALEGNRWRWQSAFLRAEPWRLQGVDPALLGGALEPAEDHLWQARLAMDSGDLTAARLALDLAAAEGPGSSRLAALRSELAMLEGDFVNAARHASVALFIAPEHPVTREAYAAVLVAQRSPYAAQAIVDAADSLVFRSQSQRYLFAAHGRLGLPVDRGPDVILEGISERLAALARGALAQDDGSLDAQGRTTLELLLRHCGCTLASDG